MVSHLLESIPPSAVYLIVGLMIMVESLGIPLPGEIALVTATVLATQHKLAVSPAWIAAAASAGAIAGDSIGFYLGHRFGRKLFDWLGRKFPRHFGPGHVALAERVFTRYGAWAVFFGRFIALLRIFAGPLAGSLRMPYPRFLIANACGGIIWATGITYVIWYLGVAAEKWLSRLSWIALVAAVLVGLTVTLLVRRKARTLTRDAEAQAEAEAAPAEAEAASAEAEAASAEAEAASAEADTAPAGTQPRAGAQAATGTQPTPRAPAGAQAATGAQAANGRPRAEPDRMAGRREGPEGAD